MREFLLAALIAGSAEAAVPTVAMNGHMPSPADLDSMAALGVSAVRVDFNWYQIEPTAGTYDFTVQDIAVQAANARGIAVYPSVGYTPQWASSVPTCTPGSPDPVATCQNKLPANVSDWTDAVTRIVTHYRGQVACWGIWNEPNLTTFFAGTEDDFVNQIFLPAATAIRAADPNAKICGPELAGLTASSNWNGSHGTCAFGSCIRNGWELDLGDMLDRVGSQIDVITQHMYKADAAGVITDMVDGEYFGTLLTHDSVKHVIASHGGAGKPVWLTESGWEHVPQGSNAMTDVATQIVALFTDQEQVCAGTYPSANVPWTAWERTFYYHFPYDPNSGWGIVDNGEVPLAPYTALLSWTQAQTTTSCGGSSPVDAGAPDAGALDAGEADAGTLLDAGLPDAGGIDAGSRTDGGGPRGDAGGPGVDAGIGPGGGQGCGCGSGAGGTLALLLLALVVVLSERQRVSLPQALSEQPIRGGEAPPSR